MPRARPADRVSLYRRMPTSWQWGIPSTIALLAIAGLIVLVRHQSASAPSVAVVSGKRLKSEERQDAQLMRQEEVPHVAKLAAGVTASVGLERVIKGWLQRQTASGALNGPVTRVTCGSQSGTSARITFHCSALAKDVSYPFDAVVKPSTHTATYCRKIEYAPIFKEKTIPVPAVCT